MKILLGIYKECLYLLNDHPYLEKFPFNTPIENVTHDPLQLIKNAIWKANKIVFALDGLKFPVNPKVITYIELQHIMNDVKLLKKTQFVLDGQFIKRQWVQHQLRNKNYGKFEHQASRKSKHSKN